MNYPNKWPNLFIPILSNFPAAAGSNLFTWDGRNTTGKISPSGGSVYCSLASTMRENVIITSGDKPLVSNLSTDPYSVNLSYGEFAQIKYTLSTDANVTITLVPTSGGTSLQLMPSTLKGAGTHELTWQGIDLLDTSGKKFVISSEGYYTVTIQAVNPVTGASSTARASLKIGL
jgi:flagellar hook assembly protein FlgD